MKVIDMRCRPAFLHDFFGASPGTQAYEAARWLNRRVGSRDDQHFVSSLTQQGFLDEVENAGLSHAVVVGRHTPGQHLPNDTIHQIVHGHERLLGIAGVDPALQGEQAAVAEAERAIKQLGLAGIDIEPGFGVPARQPDDAVYYPVYEACAALGVPVFLMSGPTTPDPRFNDPAGVARVAADFRTCPLFATTATGRGWPRLSASPSVTKTCWWCRTCTSSCPAASCISRRPTASWPTSCCLARPIPSAPSGSR
jgi:hypothetical protein